MLFYLFREEKLHRFLRSTHNKNQGIYARVDWGDVFVNEN